MSQPSREPVASPPVVRLPPPVQGTVGMAGSGSLPPCGGGWGGGGRIRFTARPPERHGGKPVTLAVGGCCCCCCCCLHTIGGIIGGITGSVRPIPRTPRHINDPNFPFPFRRDEEETIDT